MAGFHTVLFSSDSRTIAHPFACRQRRSRGVLIFRDITERSSGPIPNPARCDHPGGLIYYQQETLDGVIQSMECQTRHA